MQVEVRIPQAGTASEASMIEWMVAVGDRVQADQVLGTAETDKVVLEITSPCAGVVAELLIEPGDEVPISDPVAVIEASGEAVLGASTDASQTTRRPAVEIPGARDQGAPRDDADERVIPLSPVRRRIAENLQWVADNTVRASTTIDANLEPIAKLRERYGERFRHAAGFALTPLPFVARAVCVALPSFPDVQSSIDIVRGELTIRRRINLGIAVADENGLRVPVVHDADRMTLVELARAIRRLVDGVRGGTLDARDSQGGTFTITNPGALGSAISSPIMNRGESAILALDGVEPRAVVVDGTISVRHRAFVTLAFDHRVIDGGTAIAFLRAVERHLGSAELAAEAEALAGT